MAKKSDSAKVEKKVGGKSGKTRTRRGFWDRALQAPKVRSALTSLKVDEAAFEAAYKATRKTRERGPMTEAEVTAVKAYAEHRNLRTLATAIGKSDMSASALVTRAMEARLI